MLGLNKVAKAIFGSSNDRYLKSLRPIVMRIAGLEDQVSALTDDQLQAQTPKLKAELEAGKSLDDILPEAFRVFCTEKSVNLIKKGTNIEYLTL